MRKTFAGLAALQVVLLATQFFLAASGAFALAMNVARSARALSRMAGKPVSASAVVTALPHTPRAAVGHDPSTQGK